MVKPMETFVIKSTKGRECKIGIRKQYEFDELIANHLKPFGRKWIIIHRRYGYKAKWNERVIWLDQLDDRKPEEVWTISMTSTALVSPGVLSKK